MRSATPFLPTTETKAHRRTNLALPTAFLPGNKVVGRLTLLSLPVRVYDEVPIPAREGAEAEELLAREVYFRNVEFAGLDMVDSFSAGLHPICLFDWFRPMCCHLAGRLAHYIFLNRPPIRGPGGI